MPTRHVGSFRLTIERSDASAWNAGARYLPRRRVDLNTDFGDVEPNGRDRIVVVCATSCFGAASR
jgi:hypothetical protein